MDTNVKKPLADAFVWSLCVGMLAPITLFFFSAVFDAPSLFFVGLGIGAIAGLIGITAVLLLFIAS
jgi:hypothetical protein